MLQNVMAMKMLVTIDIMRNKQKMPFFKYIFVVGYLSHV